MTDTLAVDLDELAIGHVNASFAELHPDQTIEDAIRSLRSQPLRDRILYFYVVDDDRRLHGVVSTRHLLTAARGDLVRTLMRTDVVTLPATASLRQAVDLFVAHGLLALPVVGALGRVHGVIDVAALGADRAAAVHRRHADELFQMLGLHVSGARLRATAGDRFRALTWTIGGGTLAAAITAAHADLVGAVLALALFMPVALALSESIGMQSVALAIQHRGGGGAGRGRGVLQSARREAAVAAGIAAACAAIVAAIAAMWQHDLRLGLVVFAAITLAMTVAAAFGAVVPQVLRRLQRDPYVASGPAVLAVADVVTLIVYFRLAALFLG